MKLELCSPIGKYNIYLQKIPKWNWRYVHQSVSIHISTLNQSEIGVMFTNLTNELGHHLATMVTMACKGPELVGLWNSCPFCFLGEDMPRNFCDSWKAWEIVTLFQKSWNGLKLLGRNSLFLPKSLRPFQLFRALGHWGLAQHRALRDPTIYGFHSVSHFWPFPNDLWEITTLNG